MQAARHLYRASSLACRSFASKAKKEVIDESLLPVYDTPDCHVTRDYEEGVYDTPDSHVTRDYKEGTGRLGDLVFKVMDTSGTGLTRLDEELALWLRRHYRPEQVLLIANKAENQKAREAMSDTIMDCYRLGFGEPIAISAASGEGMSDLYTALQPHIDSIRNQLYIDSGLPPPHKLAAGWSEEPAGAEAMEMVDSAAQDSATPGSATQDSATSDLGMADSATADEAVLENPNYGVIKLAIMGQPNVNEKRSITGPEAGLTRDTVMAKTVHNGVRLELMDTAGYVGLTRTYNLDDVGGSIADMARREGAKSLAMVHVVVLVLDAQRAVQMQRVITQRELSLAGLAISEGKAMLIAANKMDTLTAEERRIYMEALTSALEERFLEAGRLPVLDMSALSGKGVDELLPMVQRSFNAWNGSNSGATHGSGQCEWPREGALLSHSMMPAHHSQGRTPKDLAQLLGHRPKPRFSKPLSIRTSLHPNLHPNSHAKGQDVATGFAMDVAMIKNFELKPVLALLNNFTTAVRESVVCSLPPQEVNRYVGDDVFAQQLYQTARRNFSRNLKEAMEARDAWYQDKLKSFKARHEGEMTITRASAAVELRQQEAKLQRVMAQEVANTEAKYRSQLADAQAQAATAAALLGVDGAQVAATQARCKAQLAEAQAQAATAAALLGVDGAQVVAASMAGKAAAAAQSGATTPTGVSESPSLAGGDGLVREESKKKSMQAGSADEGNEDLKHQVDDLSAKKLEGVRDPRLWSRYLQTLREAAQIESTDPRAR
eukprot:gene14254-20228_t